MAQSKSAAEVPSEEVEDPNEVELAWSEEIKRRIRRLEAGDAETVSEEEFFLRLRSAK